jgi:hypothetical protein
MNRDESPSPFFPAVLDEFVANEPSLGSVVGRAGEALLAVLLRGDLAPLRAAHARGVEPFHDALVAGLDRIGEGLLADDPGPGPDDLRLHLARGCVVLAHGRDHRLYEHLRASTRYRLGRHLLARPNLAQQLARDDGSFAAALEGVLARLGEQSKLAPSQFLQALPALPSDQAANRCAFCERSWTAAMPRLQVMPATLETVDGEEDIYTSREAMIELVDVRYRVQLRSDTPLQPVCSHAHVVHLLMADQCVVFDPWLGQLGISMLPPEETDPLLVGWWRYR